VEIINKGDKIVELAIEIIKKEIAQRELAQKHNHLRKEEVQLELDSLNKALDSLTVRRSEQLEQEKTQLDKHIVSGSLLSFEDITNEAKRVKESIKAFPFHDVSFQYGAEWSRDVLIEEIKRRQELIISEPDGIVRETMIANLLVGMQ